MNHQDDRTGAPPPPAEAQRHAPTLMAGEIPGEQGEVRLWAPNPWRLRADLISQIASVVFLVCFLLLFRNLCVVTRPFDAPFNQAGSMSAQYAQWWLYGSAYCVYAIIGILNVRGAYNLLRRPRYLTTDDAGIGITTRSGSRSLRWSEILSARGRSRITLGTADGKITIEMSGYPVAVFRELFPLIVNRANLYRNPADYHQFIPEEQVRDWFRSRTRDPMLDRPPLSVMRKPGRDRFAVIALILSVFSIPLFALSPLWIGMWFRHFLASNSEMSSPPGQVRSSGQAEMWRMLETLSGNDNGRRRASEGMPAMAVVWVNQRHGSDLAVPSVRGYRTISVQAEWAPLSQTGVSQNLYQYQIGFRFRVHQHDLPRKIIAALRSGHTVRSFTAGTPKDQANFMGIYSTRWWNMLSPAPVDVPTMGMLPSPRRWRFVGVSVYDNRPITWIKLANAPAEESFVPADGPHPAAAVAAWLPGYFTGDRLNCDIIYRDGGVRHLHLSPGVQVKGIKVIWQMPAKYEKELPEGPV